MSKDLKLSFILFFVFSGILVAWNTLSNFFRGVAINFVGLIGLTFVVLLLIFNNKCLFKRIKDLFIVACCFCALEILVYFAFEFGTSTLNTLKGFLVYQNVISFFGILFFVYVAFRFVTEYQNKRIKFIEILLGNEKCSTKVKKAKELSNGSLEEKPNQQNAIKETETEDENVVIVEVENETEE